MSPWSTDLATNVHALLMECARRQYETEAVDECTHALQTAHHAATAGADDELVLAALLHDVGRLPSVIAREGAGPHEIIGGRVIMRIVGARAGAIVARHVPAKRYLVSVHPTYLRSLSRSSVASLAEQGGPFAPEAAAVFAGQPWFAEAVALRMWDDRSKTPGGPAMTIAEAVVIARRFRAG